MDFANHGVHGGEVVDTGGKTRGSFNEEAVNYLRTAERGLDLGAKFSHLVFDIVVLDKVKHLR